MCASQSIRIPACETICVIVCRLPVVVIMWSDCILCANILRLQGVGVDVLAIL